MIDRPTAAQPYFPYHHRTLAEVDASAASPEIERLIKNRAYMRGYMRRRSRMGKAA